MTFRDEARPVVGSQNGCCQPVPAGFVVGMDRLDPSDRHDRIRPETGHSHRPAVERLTVTRGVKEGGHRLFLLVGVGSIDALAGSISEGHVESGSGVHLLIHVMTIRNSSCGSIEPQLVNSEGILVDTAVDRWCITEVCVDRAVEQDNGQD